MKIHRYNFLRLQVKKITFRDRLKSKVLQLTKIQQQQKHCFILPIWGILAINANFKRYTW